MLLFIHPLTKGDKNYRECTVEWIQIEWFETFFFLNEMKVIWHLPICLLLVQNIFDHENIVYVVAKGLLVRTSKGFIWMFLYEHRQYLLACARTNRIIVTRMFFSSQASKWLTWIFFVWTSKWLTWMFLHEQLFPVSRSWSVDN